jgi:hypothetical protein
LPAQHAFKNASRHEFLRLGVTDLGTPFQPITPNAVTYFYQTVDCTGQAYFAATDSTAAITGLVIGVVSQVPPVTSPLIYFAGSPVSVLPLYSQRSPPNGNCSPFIQPPVSIAVGPVQSVPVSSLGLTPPFSIQ